MSTEEEVPAIVSQDNEVTEQTNDTSSPVSNTADSPKPEENAVPEKKKKIGIVNMGGGAFACNVCEKRSYPAETVYFDSLPYHSDCFKCTKCNKRMELTNSAQYDGDLYCTSCFNNAGFNRMQTKVKWQPRTSSTTVSNSAFAKLGGGAQKCASCEKSVYPAETVTFEGKPYHQDCIACSECKTGLNLTNVSQFEGSLFCKRCWEKGGYSRKQLTSTKSNTSGSTTLNPAFAKLGGGAQKCASCEKSVYPAETVTFEGKPYHQDCLACSECKTGLNLTNVSQFEGSLFCKPCWEKGGYSRKQLTSTKSNTSGSATINPAFAKLGGGAQKCASCEKSVYPAETVTFEGKPYHQDCLACSECKTGLNLTNVSQFEGSLFCKRCWEQGGYNRKQLNQGKWEAKTSNAPVNPAFAKLGGGGTKCTNCNKTVYPAETLQYEGKPYHKECFTCSHCSIRIQVLSDAQHKKTVPYCKKCFQDLGLWRPDA